MAGKRADPELPGRNSRRRDERPRAREKRGGEEGAADHFLQTPVFPQLCLKSGVLAMASFREC
jgi:hypothetical protein